MTPKAGYGLRKTIGLGLGPAVFGLMLVSSPPAGLGEAGWRVAAVAVFMAIWWVSEALPVPITALLPILLFPLLGVTGIRAAAAPYANPIIFLFLGGFLIALAMERWNLHRRIALTILSFVGPRPGAVVAGFMVATAILSMWISNTAATAMMLPVALSLTRLGSDRAEGDAPVRPFDVALMLGIAYGATIGGLGTLIGTPPNALLAAFLSESYGLQLGFAQWMLIGVPLILVLLPISWFLLTRLLYPVGTENLVGSVEILREERDALGRISRGEKLTLAVFLAVAILWILRPLLERIAPGVALTDPGIALIGGVLLFILPVDLRKGTFLLDWGWARRLPWSVLLLFGGGLSLAAGIQGSGLADWIGEGMGVLSDLPVILIVMGIAAVIVFLTELTSNTATAATFFPVVGVVAVTMGHNPAAFAAVAALGASAAFMMPVATPPNAIVYGSGCVTIPQMLRAGLTLNVVAILLISLLAYQLVELVMPPVLGALTGGVN
jgi:sodium-dependent dicarboxylate transporter 2/3/5